LQQYLVEVQTSSLPYQDPLLNSATNCDDGLTKVSFTCCPGKSAVALRDDHLTILLSIKEFIFQVTAGVAKGSETLNFVFRWCCTGWAAATGGFSFSLQWLLPVAVEFFVTDRFPAVEFSD
jgi:hypothetical protein